MSKASEYANNPTTHVGWTPDVASYQRNPWATVTLNGGLHTVAMSLAPDEALSLARWILDTFEEATP